MSLERPRCSFIPPAWRVSKRWNSNYVSMQLDFWNIHVQTNMGHCGSVVAPGPWRSARSWVSHQPHPLTGSQKPWCVCDWGIFNSAQRRWGNNRLLLMMIMNFIYSTFHSAIKQTREETQHENNIKYQQQHNLSYCSPYLWENIQLHALLFYDNRTHISACV